MWFNKGVGEGEGNHPNQPPEADRPRPFTPSGAPMRKTVCQDCGDEIEIDDDGFRTLCGCDVAA